MPPARPLICFVLTYEPYHLALVGYSKHAKTNSTYLHRTGRFRNGCGFGLTSVRRQPKVKFKVGVTDWNLKQEDKVESIALAKSLGFDGVQVSIGKVTADKLPLSDPALQKTFLDESKRVDLPIESLCLEMLHRNYLKSDPLGQRWVADCDSDRQGYGRCE